MDSQHEDGSFAPDEPKDEWFNAYRAAATPRAHAYIANALESLFAHAAAHRKRDWRGPDRTAYAAIATSVLCDVAHYHLREGLGDGLAVTRSKQVLAERTRYKAEVMNEYLLRVLDDMVASGLLTQQTGKRKSYMVAARRTTIAAGPALLGMIRRHGLNTRDFASSTSEEVIYLHASKAKRGAPKKMDYADTETTNRMRAELQAVNARLETAEMMFDAHAAARAAERHQHWDFRARFDINPSGGVDVTQRRLRRYFTQGCWRSGGRLFGGFWQAIPSKVRLAAVRIEGEHVVSLDYTAMNAVLAYGLMGATPPDGDAYTLPRLEEHRDGVKKLFNALLFDEKRRTSFPLHSRALFPKKAKVAEVIRAIEQRHPDIAEAFGCGLGHRLMFHESEIMMKVLLDLNDQGVVALPIHDAIVVSRSKVSFAENIMLEQFRAATGLETKVKREGSSS